MWSGDLCGGFLGVDAATARREHFQWTRNQSEGMEGGLFQLESPLMSGHFVLRYQYGWKQVLWRNWSISSGGCVVAKSLGEKEAHEYPKSQTCLNASKGGS